MTAKPHPHADVLRAIADGEQMEVYYQRTSCWVTCSAEEALRALVVNHNGVRIKPAKREARRFLIWRISEYVWGVNPLVRVDCAIGTEIEVREVLPDEQ